MSAPTGKLMVYADGKFACVRISGRANFTLSPDFKTLVAGLRQKGFNHFAMELSECALMDSTFLGVLTEFGLLLSESGDSSEPRQVELFNPNARIQELLESLGVLHLFKICQGTPGVCGQVAPQEPAAGDASRQEVTRTCLEAHKTLMAVNPGNVARFKEVARFLAEDLKKMEQR